MVPLEQTYDDNGVKCCVDDDGDYVYINLKGYLVDDNFKDYFE